MTDSVSLWNDNNSTDIRVDSDEEPCCRVCHGEAEISRPLFHPCRCDGSIKFVHQDCLQTWLKVSKQLRPKCELCGEHFHFRNIYATTGSSNEPPKLSIFEFLQGLYLLTSQSIFILSKAAAVMSMWIIALPLYTYWWLEITHAIASGEDFFFYFNLNSLPKSRIKYFSFWFEGMCNFMIIIVSSVVAGQLFYFLKDVSMSYD